MAIEQPLLGQMLEQLRNQAGPGGKKMARVDFGKMLGITPTQVRNIEQGRTLKSGELEKLTAVYPQLASDEKPVLTPSPAGQRCIQCHAYYRDDGSIVHKKDCPSALPHTERPYCMCTNRNSGWTEHNGQWVCGQCGKISRMVYEQQVSRVAAAFDVPPDVVAPQAYGDLVAFNPELEDPEEQEALNTIAQKLNIPPEVATGEVGSDVSNHWSPAGVTPLIPVSEVVTRPTAFFSNSEIQTFKRCRRKWYLGWYRQLRLQARDPVGALSTGNRVHRALQAWYVPEGETPTDPRRALEVALEDDWRACTEAYAERGVQPSIELTKQFNDNASLERAMVEGYMQWLEETAIDRGLSVIAPETYLEAPLEVLGSDVDVKIIGKIDVRVVREQDGARLFIDHKTAGSLTEPLKTIRLDEQMLHYHVLEWLSDVEGGRCDGALYNMLKKVKRTARANPPFFDRVEVRHNVHELESFKKRLTGVIKTMLDTRARLDNGEDPAVVVYPTPSKDCSWSCDFLPVCPMHDDGSRAEAMIEQYYEVGDPYSYYRENNEKGS